MENKYVRSVGNRTRVDVYDVCEIFCVDDPSGATHHAIKKLLCSGQRGYKDRLQDLREAVQAVERRITMLENKNAEDQARGVRGRPELPVATHRNVSEGQ